ncbi:MAG: hypothetical protein MHPSP_003160, partial [Paramarteilia canceri]
DDLTKNNADISLVEKLDANDPNIASEVDGILTDDISISSRSNVTKLNDNDDGSEDEDIEAFDTNSPKKPKLSKKRSSSLKSAKNDQNHNNKITREEQVLNQCNLINFYEFDKENSEWCHFGLVLDLNAGVVALNIEAILSDYVENSKCFESLNGVSE